MERKIGFGQALKLFWKNYINFKGRARRSEYWYMALWHLIFIVPGLILLLIGLTTMITGISTYNSTTAMVGLILLFISWIYIAIYNLATLIPNWAMLIRRFHDTGRTMVLPLIFLTILIITCILMSIINYQDPEYQYLSSTIIVIVSYVMYIVVGVYNIVICCLDSERRTNKYGPSHKYGNHLKPVSHGNADIYN
ncbi:DUF805 domain-containing protein [Staphylococcus succinus]|uniref:DUF805 domain-containing protein n=1 Tax=Staphylococcus succinus TaxID=61015 RepID=UPI000E6A69E5|nr:DUF805 domain-containing protein [Staphylococcus succinus]RIN28028.1 DUF805 domain-containing protein [Staphylococcus succinus]RIN35192.1 DUF805 domain-containing protein [Staphylococcus succinus]RIN40972.1 DUF805 domain-containing protein [Staphylococcus succinus]